MDLDDTTKQLQDMSDQELFDLLGQIRQSRRTSKRVMSTKKVSSASAKSSVNPSTLIKSLSATDRARLMELLGGNDETGDDTEE